LLAAILGAALNGLEDHESSPGRRSPATPMTRTWRSSRNWQAPSTPSPPRPRSSASFAPGLIDNMLATKRQELRYMADLSEDERRDLYLDTV
jgi:glutamine synthetase